MKKQIFTILCFLFFQETINAQFTLEATNPNQLRLRTNGIDRMAITNGGNFAFGHTAPAGQFHFQRNSAGTLPGFGAFNTVGIFENSTDALMYLITPNTATASLNFGDTDDLSEGQIKYNHSTNTMSISANSVEKIFIKSDGKVGIGTSSPDFNTEIIADSDAGFGVTRAGGDSPGIFGRGSGGTISVPTATQTGHTLGLFGARGHNGSYTTAKSKIEMGATENWTSTATGSNMNFFTTPNGTTAPVSRVFIGNAGSVGIGTSSPDAKLDVDGDIILGVKSHEPLFPNSNIIALDREGKSVIRIIGTNTTSLSGIAGGVDGMLLYIYNYDSVNFTIAHNSATALNENRIWTGNGSDIVFTSRGGAILVYDGVNLKWRVLSYND
jgi:hypothetical protein